MDDECLLKYQMSPSFRELNARKIESMTVHCAPSLCWRFSSRSSSCFGISIQCRTDIFIFLTSLRAITQHTTHAFSTHNADRTPRPSPPNTALASSSSSKPALHNELPTPYAQPHNFPSTASISLTSRPRFPRTTSSSCAATSPPIHNH